VRGVAARSLDRITQCATPNPPPIFDLITPLPPTTTIFTASSPSSDRRPFNGLKRASSHEQLGTDRTTQYKIAQFSPRPRGRHRRSSPDRQPGSPGTPRTNYHFENAHRNAPTPAARRDTFPVRTNRGLLDAVRFVPLQRAPDMIEQSDKPGSVNTQPAANKNASAPHDAPSTQTPPEPLPAPPQARKPTPKRKLLAGALGIAVLAVLLVFGIPWVKEMLNTVSTDDAYVNGHVTFVAPRVAGQIARV